MRYLTKNGAEMEVSIVTLFALSKSVLNGSYVTIQDVAENVKYIFSKKGAYNILLDATLIFWSRRKRSIWKDASTSFQDQIKQSILDIINNI